VALAQFVRLSWHQQMRAFVLELRHWRCARNRRPVECRHNALPVTLLVVYTIVFEGYLHDTMPSKVRVGAASIVATIGYAVFLPVAYLFGAISNHHDIFHATWVIVVILAALILSGGKVMATKRRQVTNTNK
jgi:hypothetical protein